MKKIAFVVDFLEVFDCSHVYFSRCAFSAHQVQILVRHVPVAEFEAMEGDAAVTDLFIIEGQDAFEKRTATTTAAVAAVVAVTAAAQVRR